MVSKTDMDPAPVLGLVFHPWIPGLAFVSLMSSSSSEVIAAVHGVEGSGGGTLHGKGEAKVVVEQQT